jgi:peptide/nickel transport system permease protein
VTRFAASKVVHLLLVLVIVSFALTFLIDLSPGDPAFAILGPDASPEQISLVHQDLHLDEPFYERYGHWVDGILQGDFGTSTITKQPVTDVIWERLPVTLELILLVMALSLLIAIPIGIYTAYRPDGRFDRMWTLVSSAVLSVPPFVTALILVFFFAVRLKNAPLHFPATGWTDLNESVADNLWYLALPVVTLVLVEVTRFSRLLRADMISTLQEDYILAARARGVSNRRILFRHALRPSSFALVTLASLTLGQLIGAAVVVEVLFALPGLGQLLYSSILNKDVPTVQGVVMFVAIAYVVINIGVDLLYGFLDPSVRHRRA